MEYHSETTIPHEIRQKQLPDFLQEKVTVYAQRYQTVFDRFVFFPAESLQVRHRIAHEGSARLTVTSNSLSWLYDEFTSLSAIANSGQIDARKREKYENTLIKVIRALPEPAFDVDVVISPMREGAHLFRFLSWKTATAQWKPDAKRIPAGPGQLLVATQSPPESISGTHCALFDGAIASGATAMATLLLLRNRFSTFHVYAAHGTLEGVASLFAFAEQVGIDLHIHLAHATQGLNENYYAVTSCGSGVLIGDIGDTIMNTLPLH